MAEKSIYAEENFTGTAKLDCERNLKAIRETPDLVANFVIFDELLNAQHKLASMHIGIVSMAANYKNGLRPVLFSTFHKNLFAFYSAVELTKMGLYGSARPLFRYLFESMMIAKFCSISSSYRLIEKWNVGDHINLTNDVLNKIKNPINENLKHFYKDLHQFVHPTKSAQQISFGLHQDNNLDDLYLNLVFVKILLECNFHLLNRHILNSSVVYYIKTYAHQKKQEEGKDVRKKTKKLFSNLRKDMAPDAKKIISDFKKNWDVV